MMVNGQNYIAHVYTVECLQERVKISSALFLDVPHHGLTLHVDMHMHINFVLPL